MPAGFQVFDANGNLQIDVTTRLTRVIGQMDVSGTGQMSWPYPGVQGSRIASVTSKYPRFVNQNSNAYAYYDNNTGVVHYSQGEDTGPITILFIVY